MPKRRRVRRQKDSGSGKKGIAKHFEIRLFITSVVAVILAVFSLYASFSYSSLSNAFLALRGSYYYLGSSFATLQSNYLALQDMTHRPSILTPVIRIYVGTSPANATGLTKVSKDQVFCPQNATVQSKADSLFAYPYYALVAPGARFNYTFVYNTTNLQSVQVAVSQPFSIASYNATRLGAPKCGGYPNGLFQVSAVIQAPTANYTGPITVLVYHS